MFTKEIVGMRVGVGVGEEERKAEIMYFSGEGFCFTKKEAQAFILYLSSPALMFSQAMYYLRGELSFSASSLIIN